jgi:chromosome segregation ATPase
MNIDLKNLFEFDESHDEKSINALLTAINSGNIADFDYLKFRASVQNLKNLNMDEATSLKSVFATAQTMGVTKEYLLQTLNHYKNIIEKEKSKFHAALNNTYENSVKSKLEDAEELKRKIDDLQKKIEEYKNAIKNGQEQIQNVDIEISDIKNRIESAKNNFIDVISHLENSINDDESKINKIL